MLSVNIIKNNLQSFLKELEEVCKHCGRKRQDVKVVYATKYLTSEQLVEFINIAYEMGIAPLIIGENRVQEAIEKSKIKNQISKIHIKNQKLTSSGIKWIMIGTLQKNKINKALEIFEEIHSVDSLELAEAIDSRVHKNLRVLPLLAPTACSTPSVRCARIGVPQSRHPLINKKVMPIFLEVNVSGEEAKHGFTPEDVSRSFKDLKLLKSLKVKGLMTVAPHFEDPEDARPIFRALRQLADRYHLLTSMGMSNDWKQAVEEGADYIRIGGRIFQYI